jgi:putative peptidoglycan lipid II flippase
VIGIAIGTVLLPEMANRIAAADEKGARHAQARAIELTLLLSIPCIVAFMLIPDLIMRALFVRGAFTAANAAAAGHTLAAYAVGLLPFVLVRSLTATFLARGDTATPVKASLIAVAVNVMFKIVLMPLAQVGLALATSIGAWLNLALVTWWAARQGHFAVSPALRSASLRLGAAGLVLAASLWVAQQSLAWLWPSGSALHDVGELAVLAMLGALVYGGFVLALFGREWLALLRGRPRTNG